MTRLVAMSKQPALLVALYSGPVGPIEVDREHGLIRNVAILTSGQACGHGFEGEITPAMLQAVADNINSQGGVKSRVTHVEIQGSPLEPQPDDLLYRVGTVLNAHVVGGQVRGDIQLGSYAKSSPHGDLWMYLLDLADEAPDDFGLSIMTPNLNETGPIEVLSVDFVGVPAANPGGLLSRAAPGAQPLYGVSAMNPKLRKYLESIGLARNVPNNVAVAFYAGLTGAHKDTAKALADLPPELDPEKDPDAAAVPGAPIAPTTPTEPSSTPDITPTPEEVETVFVDRFVADPEMMAKYPDGADRIAKAKEFFGLFVAPPIQDPPVEPPDGGLLLSDKRAATQALKADSTRRKQIVALGKEHKIDAAYVQGLCDRNVTVAMARELCILEQTQRPIKAGATVTGGQNLALVGLSEGISDAILLRSGVRVEKPNERANQFRGLPVLGMYRQHLILHGLSEAWHFTPSRLVDLLSRRRLEQAYPDVALAMSTSDFTNILLDAINKSLTRAYEDAPTTWDRWARRTTAPDFKTINVVSLSESPDLTARYEGGEFNYVSLGDSKETYVLVEYAGGILLTRRSLINDDLDAFNRIPMLQGLAAARKEEDVAYAIITANANLADGGALFNDTVTTTTGGHANHIDSGGAITVTTMAATEKLMMLQKGPKNAARLDLVPVHLLVPVAIKAVAEQFLSSIADPANDKSSAVVNPYTNRFQLTVNARLDDDSSTAWYLFADNGQIDTIEVAFLESEQTPVLLQETDFDTDDQKFKVRHTVAAKAIDFRGVVKNDGA